MGSGSVPAGSVRPAWVAMEIHDVCPWVATRKVSRPERQLGTKVTSSGSGRLANIGPVHTRVRTGATTPTTADSAAGAPLPYDPDRAAPVHTSRPPANRTEEHMATTDAPPQPSVRPSRRLRVRRLVRWLPALTVVGAVALTPLTVSGAADTGDLPDDDTLANGSAVYTAVCSGCHQPGGVGLAGTFPPLIDNPNVADAEYVESVIRNGRDGVITVNGETYDSVMPAQSTLSDDDIADVIAFIQSGFAAPATQVEAFDTGPVAGTELPALADYAWIAAALVAIGAAALVFGPKIVAANDRRTITWVDAGLKTAVIVVGAILVTTIIPAQVLELETVQDLPRAAQDLIAVSFWIGGVGATLVALWYAHRERRV